MIKLSELKILILRLSLEGKTYQEIADEHHYCHEHIRQQGISLWWKLSNYLQVDINKRNCQEVLRNGNAKLKGLLQDISGLEASTDCDRLVEPSSFGRGAGRIQATMER